MENETLEFANEIWKDVVRYEGIYSVSNKGRIRAENYGRHSNGGQRILKDYRNHRGYRCIDLTGGPKIKYLVHLLVAEAFIGPKPTPSHQCNHINGIKDDNRVENLEYLTQAAHIAHTQNSGLFKVTLSDDDIKEIMILLMKRVPQKQIAERFNTTQATISRIKLGQTRGNLTRSIADAMKKVGRPKARPFNSDRISIEDVI